MLIPRRMTRERAEFSRHREVLLCPEWFFMMKVVLLSVRRQGYTDIGKTRIHMRHAISVQAAGNDVGQPDRFSWRRPKLSGPFLKYGHVFVGRYREEIPPSPLWKRGEPLDSALTPLRQRGAGGIWRSRELPSDFWHLFVTVFTPRSTKSSQQPIAVSSKANLTDLSEMWARPNRIYGVLFVLKELADRVGIHRCLWIDLPESIKATDPCGEIRERNRHRVNVGSIPNGDRTH
jgi:hypothetical protein